MDTTTSFKDFGLKENLLHSLTTNGFENASPIQEMTIPPILEGKDIFAQAETGSGKTGSFAIPIIELLLRNGDLDKKESTPSLYVVLSPTRELAQQTHKVFNQFGLPLGLRSSCIIGGESMDKQKESLTKGAHVLIATPGRLKDFIRQRVIDLSQCRGVVFDEADRLFDMGFKKEIEGILATVPKTRQLIMVSATSNLDVLNTAYKFHSDPLELKLNEDSLLVDHIDHKVAMISQEEKMPLLVSLLRKQENAYAIVFCNTQLQTHLVAEWLRKMDFKAKPISGRMPQNKRTRLMEEFRSKVVTILVCTDVAARGLDIKDINFVVNYDLPQDAVNYVHRIGRTGRAGKSGQAISFCAYEDCEHFDGINELIQIPIPKLHLTDEDFATNICKKPYLDFKTLQVVERDNRDRKPNNKNKDRQASRDNRERKPRDNQRTQRSEIKKTPQPRTTETMKAVQMTSDTPKVDRRFFEITSTQQAKAEELAIQHFGLKDSGLLGVEILEKGKKKFIFFGPRKNKYRYFVKPIYKRILTPFLIELVKKSQLNLNFRVSFKEPYIRVSFSGRDEGLLLKNNNELLYSFEHLMRKYLNQTIRIPQGVKFSVRCYKNSKKQEKDLMELINQTKSKVERDNKAVLLKPLTAADRRIVHQFISEDPKFKTTSIGDGRLKRIEVSLK